MAEKNNIVLGSLKYPVRFSYANFFEPRESDQMDDDGGKKKFYSTMVIIDKRDTESIEKIRAAVKGVIAEKFGGKSAGLKNPLRDGDEEWESKGEYLKGHYFFNCKSKMKPSVVGTEKDEFSGNLRRLSADEIKSGDYGRVSVGFYGFDAKTSKGVGAGLNNVQKLKDGASLGGSHSADSDFGDLATSDDGFDD